MSPRKANTDKKLSQLSRDNIQCGESDIMVSDGNISIWPDSKSTAGWIVLSKKSFNKMVDWYNKDQNKALELKLADNINCGYGRQGTVNLINGKCDITGENGICLEVDNSDGEYKAIIISVEYLQQKFRELK